MIAMMAAALMAQAAPSVDAEQLGRQLAALGTLGALLPLVVAIQTEELVTDQPGLSPAEQAELRRIAAEIAAAGKARAFAAEGHAYAQQLSVRNCARSSSSNRRRPRGTAASSFPR